MGQNKLEHLENHFNVFFSFTFLAIETADGEKSLPINIVKHDGFCDSALSPLKWSFEPMSLLLIKVFSFYGDIVYHLKELNIQELKNIFI